MQRARIKRHVVLALVTIVLVGAVYLLAVKRASRLPGRIGTVVKGRNAGTIRDWTMARESGEDALDAIDALLWLEGDARDGTQSEAEIMEALGEVLGKMDAGWPSAGSAQRYLLDEAYGRAAEALVDRSDGDGARTRYAAIGSRLRGSDSRDAWRRAGILIGLLKADGEVRAIAGDASINSVQFSPDGRRLLSASSDGTARVWDVASGSEIQRFTAHSGRVCAAKFLGDGSIISGGEDRILRVWEASSGRELDQLKGHSDVVFSIDVGPRDLVASGGHDKEILVWDVGERKLLRRLIGASDSVRGIRFFDDGHRLVAGGNLDGYLRVWDVDSGAELWRSMRLHAPTEGVAISRDDRVIAVGDTDHVRFLDASSGAELSAIEGDFGYSNGLEYSADGRFLFAAGFDKTLWLWDCRLQQKVFRFFGHRGEIWSLTVSPGTSGLVATGSADGTIRIWDTSDEMAANR